MNHLVPAQRQKLRQFLIVLTSIILGVVLVILVGHREEFVGSDTLVYKAMYEMVSQCQCWLNRIESGFNYLMLFSSRLQLSTAHYLTVVSAIQLLLVVYLAKRMANLLHYHQDQALKWVLIFMMLMLLSPFFMGAQINVLRQSISALFVLLVALSLLQGRYYSSALWMLLAVSFHSSALLFLVLLPGLFLTFNLVVGTSLILFVLYVSGATQIVIELLSSLSGLGIYQAISGYRSGAVYQSGVRVEFALFSIFPLVLFVIAQLLDATHKTQWLARMKLALKLYLLLLIPFWLFGWANYSDRFAWSAWFSMPLFLTIFIFPVLNKLSSTLLFLLMVAAGGFFISQLVV